LQRSNFFIPKTTTHITKNIRMVADTDNIRKLTSYLNFKSRIKITDGRTFIGTFVCIDKAKNIILAHTEEFRGSKFFGFTCVALS
jgi:small nuclear ribonucleoprotein (snRNP)-like protein